MTIVGAKCFSDHILMVTDSQEIHTLNDIEVLHLCVKKLETLTQIPIAWACAGPTDVGQEFNRWLKDYRWKPRTDWITFREDARSVLNRLNRDKRKFMEDAGLKPQDKDLCDVLIAGYINGEPEILVIDNLTGTYFHRDHNYGVIGSGEINFGIAFDTLLKFHYWKGIELPLTDEMFLFLMAIGAKMSPQCSPPLQKVKITKDGVLPYGEQTNP